jgi:hypothetical protein
MSEVPQPSASRPGASDAADREARRALLQDALTDLATTDDPDRAAEDVLRALDGYLDSLPSRSLGSREPPVADFGGDRRDRSEAKIVTWLVVGGAVIATGIVAVILSGGWPAGLAVIAIWAAALFALLST